MSTPNDKPPVWDSKSIKRLRESCAASRDWRPWTDAWPEIQRQLREPDPTPTDRKEP